MIVPQQEERPNQILLLRLCRGEKRGQRGLQFRHRFAAAARFRPQRGRLRRLEQSMKCRWTTAAHWASL